MFWQVESEKPPSSGMVISVTGKVGPQREHAMGTELGKLLEKAAGDSNIDLKAYVFVLAAINAAGEGREPDANITGREIALAAKDLALKNWGLMAKTVLENWGIRSTEDIGRVVLGLCDVGLIKKHDEDSPEDFVSVFDFEEVFVKQYPWEELATLSA